MTTATLSLRRAQYWWHHIENLTDGCVSLNFWFKDAAKPQKVVLPLSASQHLAMRRNIEKLVAGKLGPAKAQAILPQLASDADAAASKEAVDLRAEITKLLSQVLPEAEVDPWLKELTTGRFALGSEEGALV